MKTLLQLTDSLTDLINNNYRDQLPQEIINRNINDFIENETINRPKYFRKCLNQVGLSVRRTVLEYSGIIAYAYKYKGELYFNMTKNLRFCKHINHGLLHDIQFTDDLLKIMPYIDWTEESEQKGYYYISTGKPYLIIHDKTQK